jgi:hypothetical protein
MLDKVYGKVEMKIEVCKWHEHFMLVVSMTIRAAASINFSKWQKGQVHAHCCAKWPTKEHSGDIIRSRNISWQRS